MSIQKISRCGVVLLLAVLVSGCSLFGPDSTFAEDESLLRSNQCASDPDSCMYEGHYEPGERGYAEQEAKRLNQAALERLRRQGM